MNLKNTVTHSIMLICLSLAAAGVLAVLFVHNENERRSADRRCAAEIEAEKSRFDALVERSFELKSTIEGAFRTSPFDPTACPSELANNPDCRILIEQVEKVHKDFASLKSEQLELYTRLDNFIKKVLSEKSAFTQHESKNIGDMKTVCQRLEKEYQDELVPSVHLFVRNKSHRSTALFIKAARLGKYTLRRYAENKFFNDYMASIDTTAESISNLKDEFVQANASTNESAAASAATRYLRKAYGKDIIVSKPTRQSSGCWLFSFYHHGRQPTIHKNAILFSDGNYENCNWDSLTRFIKSEYSNPLSNEDIERIFSIIEQQMKVGDIITSEKDIPNYLEHPMTLKQLESLKVLPSHPKFVSRLYYNELGGKVLRITIMLSLTNVLEQITGESIANHIGIPTYIE